MPDSKDAPSEMSVQAHLRTTLSYITTLQSVALLVDSERTSVPHLGDPKLFPEWVGRVCDTIVRHVNAVAAALPSERHDLGASPGPCTMTPQAAARRFVRLVLRTTFDDMLDLTDPLGVDDEANARARRAAYAEVETAVRRRFRVTHDLDALEQAVRLAAHEEQGDAVAAALTKLVDAVTDELMVKQQAGYVVGVAVGRALRASASRELGGGWRAPKP